MVKKERQADILDKMKHKTLFILLIISIFLIGCSQQETNNNKLNVAVTIPPLAEFVENIGGERIAVTIIVLPGASPHTYEPTPAQMLEVSKADAYVKVGTPIEFELVWMDKLIQINKNMAVIDSSAGIDLLENEGENEHEDEHEENQGHYNHHGLDPHIWTSPKNAQLMVKNIFEGLVSIDPKNKEYYTKNKDAYLKKLKELDKKIKQAVSKKSNKRFIVYHPSWSYFAAEYGLEQIAIEEDGKEPTAKVVLNIINQANEHNIHTIFASPQSNIESAETIANEINARVVLIDELSKDYIENTEKVANAFTAD